MPNWRRNFVPGGTFFFTVVTHGRRPIFADPQAVRLLGQVLRDCLSVWPIQIEAVVLLPEHLHTIWTLPRADAGYSQRWGWIKKEFTKRWLLTGKEDNTVSDGRLRERRHGIWQPRFWEHTIESDNDFAAHFDYIHYNPVKHGHVRCPVHWHATSFHRWVKRGVYTADWACGAEEPAHLMRLNAVVGDVE